ncbi:MAG TPA: 1-deoxy-D-xylulose-5-phosphate reductoisomerase, partial [Planctomycetota bacterium]|nr:1-deoxy-D-xylulose-5-phosphate reductoisomerase [Planctomycetota bacterium]
MKRIAILGSTGSIGTQALDLIRDGRRAMFDVVGLAARRSGAALVQQAREFSAGAVCLVEGGGRPPDLPAKTGWHTGAEGVLAMLDETDPELVLNGITGAAGLAASEWTVRRGRTLALANKESLVMAGPWLIGLAGSTGARILPVDSEHCAIFQCLQGQQRDRVRRVLLTGSGGPFRTRDLDTFASITPAEALAHPTWNMGPRITVGSATMMNKAFEVIEARWLFDLRPEQITVVLHPQSIVHSMVEFVDGSILAQLGVPDMRVPILYCLTYPDRTPLAFEPFDPVRFRTLTFEPVAPARYPALDLAYEVLRRGGDSGAVLNAADEVLTEQFLAGRVPFPEISRTVSRVLAADVPGDVRGLADVMRADARARAAALAE